MIIDLMKIPRPERSGLLSVLICYALLTGYFEMQAAGGECLLPWACPVSAAELEAQKVHESRLHVVLLYNGPYPGAKKKPCTCHIDLRYYGKPIQHIHSEQELACDSERDEWTLSEQWKQPPDITCPPNLACIGFVFEDGKKFYAVEHGQGEYRLHCDTPQEEPSK